MRWNLPSGDRPGLGILDGVLPMGAQVEMEQRASAVRAYHAAAYREDGMRLDQVLQAHLGLDAFGEKRPIDESARDAYHDQGLHRE